MIGETTTSSTKSPFNGEGSAGVGGGGAGIAGDPSVAFENRPTDKRLASESDPRAPVGCGRDGAMLPLGSNCATEAAIVPVVDGSSGVPPLIEAGEGAVDAGSHTAPALRRPLGRSDATTLPIALTDLLQMERMRDGDVVSSRAGERSRLGGASKKAEEIDLSSARGGDCSRTPDSSSAKGVSASGA